MALLDGDEIVYVAQVPSKHSMRMFTEVGRRVLPHSTGVGKALLATTSDDEVRALLSRTGMPAATEKTITTPEAFLAALQECARTGTPSTTTSRNWGSAASPCPCPTHRRQRRSPSPDRRAVSPTRREKIVPVLQQVAAELSQALATSGTRRPDPPMRTRCPDVRPRALRGITVKDGAGQSRRDSPNSSTALRTSDRPRASALTEPIAPAIRSRERRSRGISGHR